MNMYRYHNLRKPQQLYRILGQINLKPCFLQPKAGITGKVMLNLGKIMLYYITGCTIDCAIQLSLFEYTVIMNKLNFVCVALVCVAGSILAVSPAQKAAIQAKLLSGGLACIKDHPLSAADIRVFRQKMLPDNENARCFAACLFKKIGIMDDMGKLSAAGAQDSAKSIFKNNDEHLSKVAELIGECSSVNEEMTVDGDKGCDRAKMAFTCLTDHAPKFNFDIDF
ncbi:general odorant-binding protein 28a [Plodia interpunctella]|uniref:general odorant-binding protein 28a n=1 Tax=Plodia interpunctella TaxID=58824 RepID=UPI002367FB61|nr:general odorant-binding protein 28a-like [Plodia interpunctella]